ncbi:MAG: hypothetical protein M3Y35_10050, partial [Actinomycetota bacterium]|nr:hypothetical protein [Actinomycetota bacterium]
MTQHTTLKNRIYIGAGAVMASVALLLSTASANAAPAKAATATPPASGTTVMMNPSRIADSRPGGSSIGTFQAHWREDLQVAGRGGVPLTGVAAVILNVTAVGPSTSGYLTVWPFGIPRPTTSNLNFTAGQDVANTVIVRLSPDGTISLYNGSAGNVDVLVDVEG